jgi:hypothetical protein
MILDNMIKVGDTKVASKGVPSCCMQSLEKQLESKGIENFVRINHHVTSQCSCQTKFGLDDQYRWVIVRENVLLDLIKTREAKGKVNAH